MTGVIKINLHSHNFIHELTTIQTSIDTAPKPIVSVENIQGANSIKKLVHLAKVNPARNLFFSWDNPPY